MLEEVFRCVSVVSSAVLCTVQVELHLVLVLDSKGCNITKATSIEAHCLLLIFTMLLSILPLN